MLHWLYSYQCLIPVMVYTVLIFFGAGDWTHGLGHSRQVLYYCATLPDPYDKSFVACNWVVTKLQVLIVLLTKWILLKVSVNHFGVLISSPWLKYQYMPNVILKHLANKNRTEKIWVNMGYDGWISKLNFTI
jgi:hypothetical protein